MHFVRRYGWKNFIATLCYRNISQLPIKGILRCFGDDPEKFIDDFKKKFVRKRGEA